MSVRRLIDTNLIVRFLVQDHAHHAGVASRIFNSCDQGNLTLVILPEVLAECVFVLESFYKHPRSNIANTLRSLANGPGVELNSLAIHLDALDRFSRTRFHFVDCVLAATAAALDLPVATFDGDFKKFGDVRVEMD